MLKQKIEKFGNEYLLLGVKNGQKVWIEKPSWDCNWYWGLGYVQVFAKNGRGIELHAHFNNLFLNDGKYVDGYKSYFDDVTLTDKEIWSLLELMKTMYNLRQYSDMLHTGGSHITTNKCSNIIKNTKEYDRINKELIPALWLEVEKLLLD